MGTLWTCGNHDPYPFVLVTLAGVPPATKVIDLQVSVDTRNAMKRILGVPGPISFYLPTKDNGGEGSLGDLVGKTLSLTVNAFDDNCQLATNDRQTQIVKDTIQQDIMVVLHAVPSCSTLLTTTINGSLQDSINGMIINYSITVNNLGSSEVSAEFETDIPENTYYESAIIPPDWTCGNLPQKGAPGLAHIKCMNKFFRASSQAFLTLTVKVNPAFEGEVSNSASVKNVAASSSPYRVDDAQISVKKEVRPAMGCGFRFGQGR